MNIKNFIVELYIIFLGITLTASIEKIVEHFNYFSAMCFVLIFFLAINFFFAKIKGISERKEKTSGANMTFNLLVVCCFSFMPYFMSSFIGIMIVLILLRIFDFLLIFEGASWNFHSINKQEKRWLVFDIIYFFIELIFLAIDQHFSTQLIRNILITLYLLLGVFEAIFDFVVNSGNYFEVEVKAIDEN